MQGTWLGNWQGSWLGDGTPSGANPIVSAALRVSGTSTAQFNAMLQVIMPPELGWTYGGASRRRIYKPKEEFIRIKRRSKRDELLFLRP
jgi:hypothetical protein